jgi:hypothetical protein
MLRKSLPGVWNKYENLLVWINIRKSYYWSLINLLTIS